MSEYSINTYGELEDFPLEIRKLLIRFREVATVCDDPRHKAALIHQRQRLINRLNEFVAADRLKEEQLQAEQATSTIIPTPETSNDQATNATESDPCCIPAT